MKPCSQLPAASSPTPKPLIYLSTQVLQAKEYLEAIIASTSDAIYTTDMSGKVLYFGPGAEKMLGVNADEVMGRSIHCLYQGGAKEAEHIMKLLFDSETGKIENYETVLSAGKQHVPVSMSVSLLRDKQGRSMGILGISKDISKHVELERRLRELSITDELTGLFNQRHFHERLSSEIQRARRQKNPLSLILIDWDHFKEINDLHGHQAGDRVLHQLAMAIARSIREGVDAGFRYGGDEFVVLLPGLSLKRASAVAQRVRASFAMHGGLALGVTFSCGIAPLRAKDTAETLVHRADERMYQGKRRLAEQRTPLLPFPASS